jgi:drug/metabolite transporter (DMT)-like permease
MAPEALRRIGLGDWLTTLAALLFAVQILLIDRFSRHMPPGRLTPGMFVATLVFGSVLFMCVIAVPPVGRRSLAEFSAGLASWAGLLADGPFVGLIAGMSFFCTVLAFHWMNKYQAHVTPGQAALIYTLEPVFAASWAMVLPDVLSRIAAVDYPSERPGWKLFVGGALVVVGNALALWPATVLKPRAA